MNVDGKLNEYLFLTIENDKLKTEAKVRKVEYLLSIGADVEAINRKGETVFDMVLDEDIRRELFEYRESAVKRFFKQFKGWDR